MTGVKRKIELAMQIEEAKASLGEPPVARTAKLADERLLRRRGILATLEFCQENELAIRAFMAARKLVTEREYAVLGGQLGWRRRDRVGGDDYTPMSAADTDEFLKQLGQG